MPLLAVTVLGADRPGIVAATTAALAAVGGNLEDSTMTLLRGRFAMLVLVRTEAAPDVVRQALAGLTGDGRLSVDVHAVPEPPPAGPVDKTTDPAPGATHVLRVHGADHPGIVSAITAVVAAAGGSLTDLSTRLTGDLYVLVAELVLDPGRADAVGQALAATGAELGVQVSLDPVAVDEL